MAFDVSGTQRESTPLLSRANAGSNTSSDEGVAVGVSFRSPVAGADRVPLLNRVFGGGSRYRSSALIRKRSMRRQDCGGEGLQGVLKELEENEGVSNRYIMLGLFAIFNHFAGGVISMMVLEGWNVYDATYFCVVTLTTVGYGDLSPSTRMSKMFVIYYVIVSIAIVSSYLAYFVGLLIDKQEELLLRRVMATESQNSLLDNDDLLDGSDYGGLVYSVVILVFVLVAGSMIFSHLEGFTALDALYATVISATTVGFGDLHPRQPSTKLCMTVWLVFSTIAVAKVVADFTEARLKVKQRALTRRVLTATLDREILAQLDQNRDGQVEWGEFLAAMLVSCGKITKEDLSTFRQRFNQLDLDGDSRIDVHTGW